MQGTKVRERKQRLAKSEKKQQSKHAVGQGAEGVWSTSINAGWNPQSFVSVKLGANPSGFIQKQSTFPATTGRPSKRRWPRYSTNCNPTHSGNPRPIETLPLSYHSGHPHRATELKQVPGRQRRLPSQPAQRNKGGGWQRWTRDGKKPKTRSHRECYAGGPHSLQMELRRTDPVVTAEDSVP